MLGSPPRAEPEFRLAHRLGAVVDVQRQAGAGPEQPFQRDRLPAEGLPVSEYLGPILDDAGDPDTDPENSGGPDARAGHDRVQAGQYGLDDHVGAMFPGIERVVSFGALGHHQIEQLDLDPGLADVDPDDEPVVGVDLEQDARAPAVGVHRAGLGDDPLVDQLANDVADRWGTETGGLTQIMAAARLIEVQRRQQH